MLKMTLSNKPAKAKLAGEQRTLPGLEALEDYAETPRRANCSRINWRKIPITLIFPTDRGFD
jgi:hypothetical protein